MIRFYLKEAIRIFSRSPFATIVVISITTIAILLTSFSLFLIFVSQQLSTDVKKNIEVVAFLDEPLDSAAVTGIKNKIVLNKSIASVKHISKDEAMKEFKRETGEDFSAVLDENPLPQSLIIKFKPDLITNENFEREARTIKDISGVADVLYENEFVIKILKYIKSGQLIIYGISFLLVLLSIYLVYVYSKVQFTTNENLYKTMKLVGSKLSALKVPILIYGIIIGILSGLLSIIIDYSIFLVLTKIFKSIRIPFAVNWIYIILISLGIALGFFGSYLSARSISLRIVDE